MKLRIVDPVSIVAVIWIVSMFVVGSAKKQETKIVQEPCTEYYRIEAASGSLRGYDSYILQKGNSPKGELQ